MLKRAPRLPPRMAPLQYTNASLPTEAMARASTDSSLACSAQHFCGQALTFRQSLVDDMQRREEELKVKSKSLEKDMNELQRRLEAVSRAEKRLAKVQRQLSEAETALQAKNSELMQLTASHAAMKQRVVELERRLESRAMNIVTAEGHITLERQRLAELKKKANDMVDEAVTAKEEAAKLCKRYLSDKAQLDEKNANYQFLQLENKELKRKLEELDRLNKVRDDEVSRFRAQQESEAFHLKQDKAHIQRMDELCIARETAIALRERELERMLKEIEGLHHMSDDKTAKMELEHQKAKLEYKSAIDSLTHRIKSKDIELSKLQMENTHLKEVTANSLSIENATELKSANKALSAHVEELTSHLLSVNAALDKLQMENIKLLEENKRNGTMLEQLQRFTKIIQQPMPPSDAVTESSLSHRPMSPAARLAADRITHYNSILSRSQPIDGLKSAINRRKEDANERLLEVQDLQQTGGDTSRLSTKSHTVAGDVGSHPNGVEATAYRTLEGIHTIRLKYERGLMQSEDFLSALHRDASKTIDYIFRKSQELQAKEELIQQICGQIKADAESLVVERSNLEQQRNEIEKIIAEEVELQLQTKLAIYEKERSAELLSPEFKKSFIEILRLHKQMPEADAVYILERIISRAASVNRSESIQRIVDNQSTSTVKNHETVTSPAEALPASSKSFRCEFCGRSNAIISSLTARDASDKGVQTDTRLSELKEFYAIADQLQSSVNKLPVAASTLQSTHSARLSPSAARPNISIHAAASALNGTPSQVDILPVSLSRSGLTNFSESKPRYSRFSMLDTLNQTHAPTMLSRTAADLSKDDSLSSRGTPSRSHSLGRTASNPDTRSVRFSGVLEHVLSPHDGAGSKATAQSILLTGDSVQALDTYLRRGYNTTGSVRPVNLISSSETMTSLADPSPSTDKTSITANTSSISTTSIGSHDRPYYREAKQNAAEINRLLMKTENLTRKPLPIQYSDATHTSISAITKPESASALLQIPVSSTSNMNAVNLPDSQLLQRVEDILNRSGAESLTLDPPSLSQSGGYLEGYMGMRGSEVPQPFPPPSTSKFSTIYGLESPAGRQATALSDNMGGSDSCIYV